MGMVGVSGALFDDREFDFEAAERRAVMDASSMRRDGWTGSEKLSFSM